MSDRRQGDRRAGIENKNINVPLTTFIYIVSIVCIIIISIIVCIIVGKINYNKGYEDGYVTAATQKFEEITDTTNTTENNSNDSVHQEIENINV